MAFEEYEDLEFTIDTKTSNTLVKSYDVPFTMVANVLIYDTRLSWKAKGIYTYLISCSPEWQFKMDEIVKVSKEGGAALRSGVRELEDYGYLTRKPRVTEEGFKGLDWILTLPQYTDNQWHYGFQTENSEKTQLPDTQWQAGFVEGIKRERHETIKAINNTNINNTNKNNIKEEIYYKKGGNLKLEQIPDWRKDYTLYASLVLGGKQKLLADEKTRADYERWYPNINYVATVEKTTEWWLGEDEGWSWLKNKRLKRINFHSRLKNNLSKNIVYRSRFNSPAKLDEVKSTGNANNSDNLNA